MHLSHRFFLLLLILTLGCLPSIGGEWEGEGGRQGETKGLGKVGDQIWGGRWEGGREGLWGRGQRVGRWREEGEGRVGPQPLPRGVARPSSRSSAARSRPVLPLLPPLTRVGPLGGPRRSPHAASSAAAAILGALFPAVIFSC